MRSCRNSGTQVDVDFPAPHVMYLHRGWKTFAQIHILTTGLVFYFKLMENGLLSVKVFGDFGTRLKCCVESSTDDEDSSSSGSDEEDKDIDDEGSRGRMPGLTRRRARHPWAAPAAAPSAPDPFSRWGQLLELLGVASLGGWRGNAGEGEEGGWRAVKSEYDGTDAFVAYW